MVRHTLKILQHLRQDFKSVSDHFTILRSKGLIEKRQMRIKTPDIYYINNDYTNVTKVYEEYIKIRKGSKHKKRGKTKN